MFGIDDVQIEMAYCMAIGMALLGMVYGVMKWNKEED
jgi:hypothetical protein